jgi:hypothetical protein
MSLFDCDLPTPEEYELLSRHAGKPGFLQPERVEQTILELEELDQPEPFANDWKPLP